MTESIPSTPALRPAATVILIKDHQKKIEVYLLKRNTKSGFMGGLYVFPGGVVDQEDHDPKLLADHVDIDVREVQQQLGQGSDDEDAAAFGIAAIRETLEEAGVFFAKNRETINTDFNEMNQYRLQQDQTPGWFNEKVIEKNFILKISSLAPWSHWITPMLMKKRFDTRFYIALMPEGQECEVDNKETTHGIWLPPMEALELNLAGKIPLSPPTVVTLTQLLKYGDVNSLKDYIKTAVFGAPIAPRLVLSKNGPVILEPWDPMCGTDEDVDTDHFSDKVLPPGKDFSRIWCDKGLWKPVSI
ncbi:MAG: NUDIX domain-containing protein [Desulfobacteraceae bacterium]|nr:NUDIX domain-containing protein [Desulfobacteraceae bacterium]